MGGTILTGTTVARSMASRGRSVSTMMTLGSLPRLDRESSGSRPPAWRKFSHLGIFQRSSTTSSCARGTAQDQWIYYGDGDLHIVRVSIANNFAPTSFRSPGRPYRRKNMPIPGQNLEPRRSAIDNRRRTHAGRQFRPPQTFCRPWSSRYGHLSGVSPELSRDLAKSRPLSKSVILTSRCWGNGAFWYNNSDHSISLALKMALYLTGKEPGTR
jgi:hypothetical protein